MPQENDHDISMPAELAASGNGTKATVSKAARGYQSSDEYRPPSEYSTQVMELSTSLATWLSFGVTAMGLGGLISQANAINDKLDPFHAHRTVEYLGIWHKRQPRYPFFVIAKPKPVGPVLKASLDAGFCDRNKIYLTRVPLTDGGPAGSAGWAVLLTIFHANSPLLLKPATHDAAEKGSISVNGSNDGSSLFRFQLEDPSEWDYVPYQPLIRHLNGACVNISRTTLIVLLCVTNARPTFYHSDAAGFRAGYASYCGQWLVTWPIGQEAIVKFAPHDSHSQATDVYPPSFPQRVDCCVRMLAGIVATRDGMTKTAFCGRKAAGSYTLRHVSRGFPGAHGSRHLYNMMGGRVYEVDFLSAVHGIDPLLRPEHDNRILQLPSREDKEAVEMMMPQHEEKVIKTALDNLPWTTLSWSIHRGMRDILLAYGKPIMDDYRSRLADIMRQTVAETPHLLVECGWNSAFVHRSMGEMAASAVMEGKGNSGDLVRVVTDIIQVRVAGRIFAKLDETNFWRLRGSEKRALDEDGIVALTKFFVLEWSVELDYQLYHEMPLSMYLG